MHYKFQNCQLAVLLTIGVSISVSQKYQPYNNKAVVWCNYVSLFKITPSTPLHLGHLCFNRQAKSTLHVFQMSNFPKVIGLFRNDGRGGVLIFCAAF